MSRARRGGFDPGGDARPGGVVVADGRSDGADANWGRVICAVGYSGAPVAPDKVDIAIGGIPVVRHSLPVAFDEDQVSEAMKGDPAVIEIDLNQGNEKATAWGCDLTYDYVRINASYRT